MNIERVEWVDSSGNGRWRTRAEILSSVPLSCCTTVGFVLDENDEAIWLIQSYDEQVGDEQNVNNTLVIPKVAITKREVIG